MSANELSTHKNSVIINAVDRALEVLLYINTHNEPVSISQISKDLNLHKSTVFRTLATLENRYFVQQNQDSGKYSIGIGFFSFSRKISIKDFFQPFADTLQQEFNEAVNVSILDKSVSDTYYSVIITCAQDSENVLSAKPRMGSSMPCYCSSVGKCLLAFSKGINPKLFERYTFKTYTEHTLSNVILLNKELEQVRMHEYAIDNEEGELGLSCVGVPILDKSGYAIAAMSINGPTKRLSVRGFANIAERLKKEATRIGEFL